MVDVIVVAMMKFRFELWMETMKINLTDLGKHWRKWGNDLIIAAAQRSTDVSRNSVDNGNQQLHTNKQTHRDRMKLFQIVFSRSNHLNKNNKWHESVYGLFREFVLNRAAIICLSLFEKRRRKRLKERWAQEKTFCPVLLRSLAAGHDKDPKCLLSYRSGCPVLSSDLKSVNAA